jgi:hypothetical protein
LPFTPASREDTGLVGKKGQASHNTGIIRTTPQGPPERMEQEGDTTSVMLSTLLEEIRFRFVQILSRNFAEILMSFKVHLILVETIRQIGVS